MKSIEFEVQFPDSIKKIKVTEPMGAGRIYHVSVDSYFEGQLIRSENGGWRCALNSKTILTGDDVAAIIFFR
jgi:hypothetical protein